jgi:hypothetical protein
VVVVLVVGVPSPGGCVGGAGRAFSWWLCCWCWACLLLVVVLLVLGVPSPGGCVGGAGRAFSWWLCCWCWACLLLVVVLLVLGVPSPGGCVGGGGHCFAVVVLGTVVTVGCGCVGCVGHCVLVSSVSYHIRNFRLNFRPDMDAIHEPAQRIGRYTATACVHSLLS